MKKQCHEKKHGPKNDGIDISITKDEEEASGTGMN